MKSKLFVFLAVLISLTSCGETVIYSRKNTSQRTDISYIGTTGEEVSHSNTSPNTNPNTSANTGVISTTSETPIFNSSHAPAVSVIDSDARVIKVFDTFVDYEVLDKYTVYLREIDNEPFIIRSSGQYQHNGTSVGFAAGASYALYLYDINGDGYRDFAWVIKDPTGSRYELNLHNAHNFSSGLMTKDYKRGDYSYFLEARDASLYVRETKQYYTDKTTGSGRFVVRNSYGYIEWLNIENIVDFSFKVMRGSLEHTPVETRIENGVTKFFGNSSSLYVIELVFVSPNEISDTNVQISISGTMDLWSSVVKVDGAYRYATHLTNDVGTYYLDFTVYGITKRIEATGDNQHEPLRCLGDYVDWAKNTDEESFYSVYDTDSSELSYTNFCKTYSYKDQSSFKKLSNYFDNQFFEVDPKDFLIDKTIYHHYEILLADLNADGISLYLYNNRYLKYGNRWFVSRYQTYVKFNTQNANDSYLLFDENITSFYIYSKDGSVQPRTFSCIALRFRDDPGVVNDVTKANYYFMVNNQKYYITGRNTFCNALGSKGYKTTNINTFPSYVS